MGVYNNAIISDIMTMRQEPRWRWARFVTNLIVIAFAVIGVATVVGCRQLDEEALGPSVKRQPASKLESPFPRLMPSGTSNEEVEQSLRAHLLALSLTSPETEVLAYVILKHPISLSELLELASRNNLHTGKGTSIRLQLVSGGRIGVPLTSLSPKTEGLEAMLQKQLDKLNGDRSSPPKAVLGVTVIARVADLVILQALPQVRAVAVLGATPYADHNYWYPVDPEEDFR